MKNVVPSIFVLVIALALFSCGKGSTNDNGPTSIVGNWSIVSDSSYTTGIGAYGPPSGNKYIGTAADHYDFTSDGGLTIHEGTIMTGTASYTVGPDTITKLKKVNIKFSNLTYDGGTTLTNASKSFDISSLTNNSMVLTSSLLSPGGAFYETVVLKK
jgi:hypothetical protein